jgi:enolase
MKIRSIKASEILDSRANPTISVTVVLEDGSSGTSAVPSGASTGTYEAHELRDGDMKRFAGFGVLKAVSNVDKIAEKLVGMEASEQQAIDQTMIELDGTENKSNLGANAILGVSLAVAVAEAKAEKKHLFAYLAKFNPDYNGKFVLPIPMMNIMNGGKHANWATDIQEYMILPIGAKTMAQAVRMGAEVYGKLKEVLKDKKYNLNVGDEGGFAPDVSSNAEPFDLISQAVEHAGYQMGSDIVLGIDAAASEFFVGGQYELKKENKTISGLELVNFYKELVAKYPIVSLEDPFAEDDWESFATLTASLSDKQIVGDDLYVTNLSRLKTGIEQKASNSILIKLNQIGTLSETMATILESRKHGLTAIISHRSGETEDTFIADLVVAFGTGQIKTGAPARSERVAKYNRLMKIEELINTGSEYAKWPF